MITPPNIPGVPEYNWIPPEWVGTKPDLSNDPLSQDLEPVFRKPTPLNGDGALAGRLAAVKTAFSQSDAINHVQCTRSLEPTPNADTSADLTKIPHPNSDFSHVDPGVYKTEAPPYDEQAKFLDAIHAVEALESLAARDETMQESIQEALLPLRKAEDQLVKAPKRLSRIFENNLCKVTVLYGELSAALENADAGEGKIAYTTARTKLVDLIKDLDDSEPRQVEAGELGYGRAFKWSYIRPIIHGGKIKGAKIMAKWNPHMSSSGIPIPHT